MQDQSVVLIIYKGKILLSSADSPFEDSVWSFIGEKSKKTSSQMDGVLKAVKNITKLNSLTISRVSLSNTENDYVFYTKLSDKNVNSIERQDGQRLEFYRLEEIEKLSLSALTGSIVSTFKTEIVNLLND